MNKKQQEEQRRREDQALKQGLLWVAGAVVLEMLLFLVNRYAFDFEASAQGVALAESLRMVLNAVRVLGLAAFVGGGVFFAMQVKKSGKTALAGVICAVGAVLLVCGHVAVRYHDGGMRMLYLLVPVMGALALSYYIYQKEFFLSALPAVLAVLGLWFVRVGGMSGDVIGTVLLCAALLVAVLKIKSGDGCLKVGEASVRLLPEKANYTVMLASSAAALAVQLLAMFAGSAVAYYLIFAMSAWLFAMLVYYTVKML